MKNFEPPYLAHQYFKDKEELLKNNREMYEEWSFQACPFDPANPAFYIKDRNSYKAWGKNREKKK